MSNRDKILTPAEMQYLFPDMDDKQVTAALIEYWAMSQREHDIIRNASTGKVEVYRFQIAEHLWDELDNL